MDLGLLKVKISSKTLDEVLVKVSSAATRFYVGNNDVWVDIISPPLACSQTRRADSEYSPREFIRDSIRDCIARYSYCRRANGFIIWNSEMSEDNDINPHNNDFIHTCNSYNAIIQFVKHRIKKV